MTDIDAKLLRAFITLAEKGNYNKAAEALFLTQPALSKRIQVLEERTGGKLFQRGRHGAVLTTFGQSLYTKACELVTCHNDFLTYAQEIQKRNAEKLVLGFGISTFNSVPVWVNYFRKKFPDCEVTISQYPSTIQTSMLISGELHIGFFRMPVTEPLVSKFINEEKLVLAIPSSIEPGSVNLQGIFSAHPLLCLETNVSPCLAEWTETFLRENQLIADPVPATNDIHSLLALIAGGVGVALLPESARYFLPAGVKLIYPQENTFKWNIGMAWNPHINNKMRDEFLQIVTTF